ncbi:NAD(P)-binding domain-containing protein, partial [Salmonella sp. s51228]|uniref:NAD(P)-binding domain-containing protein n=1 Tax=Salmonella sp. s51228 TaxID=3159652 RepID=UPI00398091EE
KSLGADLASTPSEVAKKCSVIISMLPAGSNVRDVYTNSDGLLSSVSPHSILIDCSTCEPELSQHLSALAYEKQAAFIDSPVSGGVLSARDAKLTFMAGGPIETLN